MKLLPLVFLFVVACDDEYIPPKTPPKIAVAEATPAERREAACKSKELPGPMPAFTPLMIVSSSVMIARVVIISWSPTFFRTNSVFSLSAASICELAAWPGAKRTISPTR